MFQALPAHERFGLLFEQVTGAGYPLVTAAIGASRDTYALALHVAATEIPERWRSALTDPQPPRVIDAIGRLVAGLNTH